MSVEIGYVNERGVYDYAAQPLIPGGLGQLRDLRPATLMHRAVRSVDTGLRSLRRTVDVLADLLHAVGELEPPLLLWRADGIGLWFATRDEAEAAALAASAEET
jgi:hypothetical protein